MANRGGRANGMSTIIEEQQQQEKMRRRGRTSDEVETVNCTQPSFRKGPLAF